MLVVGSWDDESRLLRCRTRASRKMPWMASDVSPQGKTHDCRNFTNIGEQVAAVHLVRVKCCNECGTTLQFCVEKHADRQRKDMH